MAANPDDLDQFLQNLQQLGVSRPSSSEASIPNASFDPSVMSALASSPKGESEGEDSSSESPVQVPSSGGGMMPPAVGQMMLGSTEPSGSEALRSPEALAPSRPPLHAQNFSWGQGLGDSDMAAAQEQARKNRMIDGIFSALAQGSATMTRTPYNAQLYKGLEENADQPVQQIQQGRQAMGQKMQALSQALNIQNQEEASDPTSSRAKIAQDLAIDIAKKAKMNVDPETIRQLSPNDINEYMSGLLKADQIQSRADDNKFKMGMLQQNKDLQTLQKQGVAKSKLVDAIENTKARGSVKNAWDAVRLTDNVDSLLNEYPDLNKMPQAQVNLLTAELAKVAGGGAATEAGQRDLRPTSAFNSVMQAYSKLSNSPSPSELGSFLQTYKPYAAALKNNARSAIGDSVTSRMMGYSNQLSPQDLTEVKNNYAPYITGPKGGTAGSQVLEQQSPHGAGAGGSSKGSVSASTLQQYADKHGVSVDQAKQLLQQAGYSVGQ